MTGKIRIPDNQIWVWTEKAEQFARENFATDNPLDKRIAGTPATCGIDQLGQCAPSVWVARGHVVAKTVY